MQRSRWATVCNCIQENWLDQIDPGGEDRGSVCVDGGGVNQTPLQTQNESLQFSGLRGWSDGKKLWSPDFNSSKHVFPISTRAKRSELDRARCNAFDLQSTSDIYKHNSFRPHHLAAGLNSLSVKHYLHKHVLQKRLSNSPGITWSSGSQSLSLFSWNLKFTNLYRKTFYWFSY